MQFLESPVLTSHQPEMNGDFWRSIVWHSIPESIFSSWGLHARDPVLYSITMDCVPQSQRSRWAALNSSGTPNFTSECYKEKGPAKATHHKRFESFLKTAIQNLMAQIPLSCWVVAVMELFIIVVCMIVYCTFSSISETFTVVSKPVGWHISERPC